MTNDGQNTLVYDGENHAVSATVTGSSSGSYTYDGNGLRVQKVSVISGTTTTTVYVFSGSKVIAEYVNGALPSAPTREYVYAGAALLAKIDSAGTKYYHQDHLSNRLVTDSSGNTSAQMGHFPFGESWYNATNDKLVFASYERDSESGNDYAMARYYVNRLARFSSPDAFGGSTDSPQSLNRYSYVLNAPTSLVDPSGMEPCEGIYDAKRRRRKTRLMASKLGPYSPEEADAMEQDPGGVISDCTIESGVGVPGITDPPLDPMVADGDMLIGPAGYSVEVSASLLDIPLDDPYATPEFGTPYFGSDPGPLAVGGPRPPFNPCDSSRGRPYGQGHNARDYSAPGGWGTTVVAPDTGKISGELSGVPHAPGPYNYSMAGPTPNYVQVTTITNWTITYFHVSPLVPKNSNPNVVAGQPIGKVDNSGRTTGPHTHVQVTGPNGRVDPNSYFSNCLP
jgi:RHS repeat-associated protein